MFKKHFKIISGNWLNGEDGLSEPFNKKKILFLDEISKEILNDEKLNIYPDLKDFGFWLIGYDGEVKSFSLEEKFVNEIFYLIDQMPIRQQEMLMYKKKC